MDNAANLGSSPKPRNPARHTVSELDEMDNGQAAPDALQPPLFLSLIIGIDTESVLYTQVRLQNQGTNGTAAAAAAATADHHQG